MKLKLYQCQNDTISLDDKPLCLEIERQSMFVEFADYFRDMTLENQYVAILENDKYVAAKDVCALFDITNVSLTNKTFLNKLYKKVETDIVADYELKLQLDKIYATIISYFDNLISQYNCDLTLQRESKIKDFLDLVQLAPRTGEDYLDNLLNLIALSAELDLFRLIVIVNQRAFLTQEQLQELYKFCLYKKQKLLVLERYHDPNPCQNERKLYIDQELFEFLT